MAAPRDSFPRQQARTQRFSLGRPRSFTVSPDGAHVVFLRSRAGDDPVNALWALDVGPGEEHLVFEPLNEERLSREERARRERARERAQGIVSYSTDLKVERATFHHGDDLWIVDLPTGNNVQGNGVSAIDPRLDPTGTWIAYVDKRSLRVVNEDDDEVLWAGDDDPKVSWGLAEFVAAEEMGRTRGFWWSPDGERIAATRVDESPVTELWIHDAIDATSQPRSARFPLAGTKNADVALWILGFSDKGPERTEVRWDRERFEYLARVVWAEPAPLTILVQSRDQTTTQTLAVDDSGATTLIREDSDERWVELVDGSPAYLDDGTLVSTVDRDDTRRLLVGDEIVTPPGLQVHRILDSGEGVLFNASEEPTEDHVWRWSPREGLVRLTDEPGVHAATGAGDVVVVTSDTLDGPPTCTVYVNGEATHTIESHHEEPVIQAAPVLFSAGSRELRSALLTPGGEEPPSSR